MAVQENNSYSVLELIKCSADLSVGDEDGNTPLHTAVIRGDLEAIQTILKADKSLINHANTKGSMPLHEAIIHDQPMAVEMLIQEGSHFTLPNEAGITPLHLAVIHDRVDIAEMLIRLGAYVNCVDLNDSTPLHLAAVHDRLKAARMLIFSGADVNSTTIDLNMPLHLAAMHSTVDFIQLLFDSNAVKNCRNLQENTPLHLAAMCDKDEIIHKLIQSGARMLSTNVEGSTPLHLAAKHDNIKAVKAFMRYKKSLMSQVRVQQMCKILSIIPQNPAVVMLSSLHSKLNAGPKDKSGNTPLHVAAIHGKSSVIETLVSCFNIDDLNDSGSTALHVAVANKWLHVVVTLIQLGANVNLNTWNSNAPLHVAAIIGESDMIEILIQSGSNINLQNQDGHTPLIAALNNLKSKTDEGSETSFIEKCFHSAKTLIKYHFLMQDETLFQVPLLIPELDRFIEDCKGEVKHMKSTLLRRNLSLHKAVFMSNTGVVPCEKLVVKHLIEVHGRSGYPIYYDVILSFIVKRLNKQTLQDLLVETVVSIVADGKFKTVLNCDAFFCLSKFLSKLDIFNLISAICGLDLETKPFYLYSAAMLPKTIFVY